VAQLKAKKTIRWANDGPTNASVNPSLAQRLANRWPNVAPISKKALDQRWQTLLGQRKHLCWPIVGPTTVCYLGLAYFRKHKLNDVWNYKKYSCLWSCVAYDNRTTFSKYTPELTCVCFVNWPIDSPQFCPAHHDLPITCLNTDYNMKAISRHYNITDQLSD